jgi:AcrR family transcriptional regulator
MHCYFDRMKADDQKPKTPYHHGDLRAALLAAAEAELAETGIEAFSLRHVARRAGVSHAAPAHHFGDANGLLTALAAEGFRRFLATQLAAEASVGHSAEAQLKASGVGYVEFALTRPALFRLLFGSGRPDYGDPDLKQAAEAAYDHLNDLVARTGGGALDAAAAWAMAHGLADLMAGGRLKGMNNLSEVDRARLVADMIGRSQRSV